MQDAWRAYLELAFGMTEASRKRAQTVARKLVGQSGVTAAQLQALAEELFSTGMANRSALIKIVRAEVDRALGAVGLATADEVAALTGRIARLEQELHALTTGAGPAGGSAGPATQPGPAAPRGTTAIEAVARKAVATTTDQAAAEPSGTGRAVAERPVAKKAVAKKIAKKAVAKKSPGATS